MMKQLHPLPFQVTKKTNNDLRCLEGCPINFLDIFFIALILNCQIFIAKLLEFY